MTEDLIFIILFLLIVTVFAIPLGKYMSKVFTGERTFMTPVMRPLEKFIYRIGSVDENQEITLKRYAYALIIFNIIGILFLFVLQLIQNFLHHLIRQVCQLSDGTRLLIPLFLLLLTLTGSHMLVKRP